MRNRDINVLYALRTAVTLSMRLKICKVIISFHGAKAVVLLRKIVRCFARDAIMINLMIERWHYGKSKERRQLP